MQKYAICWDTVVIKATLFKNVCPAQGINKAAKLFTYSKS